MSKNVDDRTAIADLTIDYCWSLDLQDFDRLRHIFLPDASFDVGGTVHVGIDAIIAKVSAALTPMDASHHLISNHQIRVDGDSATSRCYLQAQHVREAAVGGKNFIIAGRYEDTLTRTPDGWRIAYRTLVRTWWEGNPEVARANPLPKQ
jgi:SnoaL-like domain